MTSHSVSPAFVSLLALLGTWYFSHSWWLSGLAFVFFLVLDELYWSADVKTKAAIVNAQLAQEKERLNSEIQMFNRQIQTDEAFLNIEKKRFDREDDGEVFKITPEEQERFDRRNKKQ
jgi:hypothetical protein